MRILTFDASVGARQSYDIFMVAMTQDPREHNRQALKKIVVLQDLLESIGFVVEAEQDDDGYKKGNLRLAKQPCELILEEAQYDELKQTMDAIKWRAVAAKVITAAYDLLDAAQHVNAKELEDRKVPLTLT